MRNITREQIINLFDNPQKAMYNGLWFSGYGGEGEYREWWDTGQQFKHCFYKNGKYDGEYKSWWDNEQLQIHCFYKNGKEEGEYKGWNEDGVLVIHRLYKNSKVVKDYLRADK